MSMQTISSLLILTVAAMAASINNYTVCDDYFGLCSTAYCNAIPGNSTFVTCACEGPFQDLNIGTTTCLARTQQLTSTFSIHNAFVTSVQPQLHFLSCTGSNAGPWASCFDAPCSTQRGVVNCTCPVQKASANSFITETCPTTAQELKAICSQMRSAVSPANAGGPLQILQSFYGNPPQIPSCPAVS